MNLFNDREPSSFLPASLGGDDLCTPALSINMPSVRHNIARIIDVIGDEACWRPHVKTTKLPEVWQLLIDAGVDRFKCATTREMSLLLELVPDIDVLLAHHPGPATTRRLGELADAHPAARISALVETEQQVAALPDNVTAFVDINPGMNRSGIPMNDLERIEMTMVACGDRWRGLHFYEGHIRGGEETSRRERAHAAFDALLEIDANLGGASELITSGTPTFLHALSHARLVGTMRHSVSPGTVVFHDAISERIPEIARLGLQPAAAVLAHVVSHPCEQVATVNAGHKSVSADSGDPCCMVLGWPQLVPLHPSEEHMPLQALDTNTPSYGELLALIPEHVCPTVNLSRYAILCEENTATVVPIEAAGHESPLVDASV